MPTHVGSENGGGVSLGLCLTHTRPSCGSSLFRHTIVTPHVFLDALMARLFHVSLFAGISTAVDYTLIPSWLNRIPYGEPENA